MVLPCRCAERWRCDRERNIVIGRLKCKARLSCTVVIEDVRAANEFTRSHIVNAERCRLRGVIGGLPENEARTVAYLQQGHQRFVVAIDEELRQGGWLAGASDLHMLTRDDEV